MSEQFWYQNTICMYLDEKRDFYLMSIQAVCKGLTESEGLKFE